MDFDGAIFDGDGDGKDNELLEMRMFFEITMAVMMGFRLASSRWNVELQKEIADPWNHLLIGSRPRKLGMGTTLPQATSPKNCE
eukprot:scaffold67753_cov66-Cyclotella_meneghiniana.AAC.9